MATTPKIKSFAKVVPMIYAYNTPGIPYHDGWTKIGYTEKQSAEQRIAQQTKTAGIKYDIAWQDNAMFKDGSGDYFTDHDFHRCLEVEYNVVREKGTEWFNIDGDRSLVYFNKFARRQTAKTDTAKYEYGLREEQDKAVAMTKSYFENGGVEFLWNAKPRFGKTLSTYDLVRKMGFKRVLIVTNRPSIANSWAEDFRKFIGWRDELCFVSDTDALSGKPGVLSREEYIKAMQPLSEDKVKGMIAFESLQGLKGSVYFGGQYDKLEWIKNLEFDLLVVDEAQEGVETMKTERAFHNIKCKHTLYLSGTPFKQLASAQFNDDQIYNWSYADEQEKKVTWEGEEYNPYESLPRLSMYTYQLSNMIYDQITQGVDLSDDETSEFAFDLNEFFETNENGKFVHEEEIKKFLHILAAGKKYPFSTEELRKELSHTIWILNRVNSCKALEKLLKEDDVFKDYKIVLAAGDGKTDDDTENAKAFDRVKEAIAENDKTITLSVGQLTVGVTIPEWSGVLMLCNMKSPSSYMQAAFRAQNPCSFTVDGQRYRKETAYVFDFDPARTLIIFDEFANNLSRCTVNGGGTGDERKSNIKRLLNFFPVLGEDSEGEMVELDATQVLSIPRKIKSQEVVRRGFMSNFLFQNISGIFGAPAIVREIVEKLDVAHEERARQTNGLDHITDVNVDEEGEVDIPQEIVIGKTQNLFGDKVYETFLENVQDQIDDVVGSLSRDDMTSKVQKLVDTVKETVKNDVITPAVQEYDVKKSTQNRLEKQVEKEIDKTFTRLQDDYVQQTNIAKVEFERKQQEAETAAQVKEAEKEYRAKTDSLLQSFVAEVQNTVEKTIEEKPQELVEQLEKHKAEEEKKTVEDSVRDHLRGFARTIPSFIMAYGDGKLTLANFDDYTEDDVFLDVTGITEDDFRFLRDGGDYEDSETGEIKHFNGHLFDETVFDDSILEFWKKKQELADYFDESKEEDIFDYIPPQKTNQIFTPKWVVKKMVDQLEDNNPGCFDDSTKTFADLYMKSGLYITEIVKRLYRSEGLKKEYPDDHDRIKHILSKQVYGMAPTRIIYLIATNYILGFDEELKLESTNFVEADAAMASKNGTLEELVERHFGDSPKGISHK